MRAAFLVGCIVWFVIASSFNASPARTIRASSFLLDGPSITPQPYGREDKCGGECQPDPEIRRAQISARSQLGQRMNVWVVLPLEIKGLRRESHQAVSQHPDKMRGVKGNRFVNGDREQRKYRPKKCHA